MLSVAQTISYADECQYCHVLGGLYVTYRRVLDWMIYWHVIHKTPDYRQYSAIADLHTLQFTVTHALGHSVFTSIILVTDLYQSHCHFKLHMKSSFHGIIRFFSLFYNYQLNSIPLLSSSYPGRLASRNSTRLN
jgi:hypothetical protein